MIKNIKFHLKKWFWFCPENFYYPVILETKVLAILVIILFFLKALTIPFLIFISKTPFFAQITKSEIVELTNLKRIQWGLAPLKEDPILEQAAYLKARDMLEKGYFSHWSPDGKSPWYWFKIVNYDYQAAGENLAIGFLNGKEVVEAWFQSVPHQKNILNKNYQEIGIAVLTGNFQGATTTLVVQLFGAKKEKSEEKIQIKKESSVKVTINTQSQPKLKKETLGVETSQVTSSFSSTPTLVSVAPLEERPKNFQFKVLNLGVKKYSNFINFLNYLLIFFIIAYLLAGIFIDLFIYKKYVINYYDLIPKLGFFVFLFLICLLFDEFYLTKIIPHSFKIF